MSHTVIKSATYAPGRMQITLAAQYADDELYGYFVRTEYEHGTNDQREDVDLFPVSCGDKATDVYSRAAERFRNLVQIIL